MEMINFGLILFASTAEKLCADARYTGWDPGCNSHFDCFDDKILSYM